MSKSSRNCLFKLCVLAHTAFGRFILRLWDCDSICIAFLRPAARPFIRTPDLLCKSQRGQGTKKPFACAILLTCCLICFPRLCRIKFELVVLGNLLIWLLAETWTSWWLRILWSPERNNIISCYYAKLCKLLVAIASNFQLCKYIFI